MNFTTTLYLPTMTSTEDSGTIMSMGESTKNSMLFTLFVPFGFMLWSFVTIPGGFALYTSLRKDFSDYFQEMENEN